MDKGGAGKVRRHSYSMAQMKLAALARAEHAAPRVYYESERDCPGWDCDYRFDDWNPEGDFESFKEIQDGKVGWDASMLPEGAHVVGLLEMAEALSNHDRGFCLLTGWEATPAGLDEFRMAHGDQIGKSASFCIDGHTYTAFEDPSWKGSWPMGSRLGMVVKQEGNFCLEPFKPVGVEPRFSYWDKQAQGGEGQFVGQAPEVAVKARRCEIFELIDPSSRGEILSVGDQPASWGRKDFVLWMSPSALDSARAAGVAESLALARDLQTLTVAPSKPKTGRL